MKKLTVNIGERFNKLTVVELKGVNEKGFSVADCRCDCGGNAIVKIAELRNGHKKSCGCESSSSKSRAKSADIIGKRFSRLLVESLAGTDNRKYRLCNCLCDCGVRVKIRIARMLSGESQSCGCLQLEKAMENIAVAQKSNITHGLSGTLTGRSWLAMMQRCYNAYSEVYHRYGAVGVYACEFLRSSPVNLMFLIGERPSALMSLDRIDGTMGYWCGCCAECLTDGLPLNVKWSTADEQQFNRCSTRMVEIDGVIKQASEWCRLLGLSKTSKQIYTYPKKL